MEWPNHASQLVGDIGRLRQRGELFDVVLSAEGKHARAHRVVLAAASEYFHVSKIFPHKILMQTDRIVDEIFIHL